MRILYDVGFAHGVPFRKKEQFNKALVEITDYLLDVTLTDLEPPTDKIDKLFVESLSANEKYNLESLKDGSSWISPIKKLYKKYKPQLIGIERTSYYFMHSLSAYVTTNSRNKILSKIFGKLEDVFSEARTQYFAKTISEELKEGEIGLALHGEAHEITNYLNRMAPDIAVYPVRNKMLDLMIENMIRLQKQKFLKW
jgi:hypothetical protein